MEGQSGFSLRIHSRPRGLRRGIACLGNGAGVELPRASCADPRKVPTMRYWWICITLLPRPSPSTTAVPKRSAITHRPGGVRARGDPLHSSRRGDLEGSRAQVEDARNFTQLYTAFTATNADVARAGCSGNPEAADIRGPRRTERAAVCKVTAALQTQPRKDRRSK